MAAVANLVRRVLRHRRSPRPSARASSTPPPGIAGLVLVGAALIGAIGWNLLTWWYGLPSSSSHALIGGLGGAALAAGATVKWDGILDKVVIPMVISPIAGIILGYLVMTPILWMLPPRQRRARSPAASATPRPARPRPWPSATACRTPPRPPASSSSPSTSGGYHTGDSVPIWVLVLSAIVISLGTYAGGWRIMRTLGRRIIHLDPPQGFAAETTAASILYVAGPRLRRADLDDAHDHLVDHGRRRDQAALARCAGAWPATSSAPGSSPSPAPASSPPSPTWSPSPSSASPPAAAPDRRSALRRPIRPSYPLCAAESAFRAGSAVVRRLTGTKWSSVRAPDRRLAPVPAVPARAGRREQARGAPRGARRLVEATSWPRKRARSPRSHAASTCSTTAGAFAADVAEAPPDHLQPGAAQPVLAHLLGQHQPGRRLAARAVRVELTEVLPGAVRLGDRAVLTPQPVDPRHEAAAGVVHEHLALRHAATPSCHSRVKDNDSSHVSRRGSISAMPSSAARMPGQWRCWRRSLRSSRTVVSPSRTAASATRHRVGQRELAQAVDHRPPRRRHQQAGPLRDVRPAAGRRCAAGRARAPRWSGAVRSVVSETNRGQSIGIGRPCSSAALWWVTSAPAAGSTRARPRAAGAGRAGRHRPSTRPARSSRGSAGRAARGALPARGHQLVRPTDAAAAGVNGWRRGRRRPRGRAHDDGAAARRPATRPTARACGVDRAAQRRPGAQPSAQRTTSCPSVGKPARAPGRPQMRRAAGTRVGSGLRAGSGGGQPKRPEM